jgi:YD repeat-containing protein
VLSSEKANGAEKLSFLYNADKSTSITDYTPSSTGVGAPTATTRTHRFGYAQGVVRPTSVTAPCPVCGNTAASTAYDANGNVSQRTEHDGTVTKFTYDNKNRETSRVEAFGTAAAKTYTTQWHGTWNLPTLRTEPFKITAYTYDAKGNLTGQADTPTTDANGSQAAAGVRDSSLPIDSIGYTYDANSLAVGNANATQIKTPQGQWIAKAKDSFSIVYNSLGELVSSTTVGTQAKIKSIVIDKHGNYLQIQAPDLTMTTMQFNLRNTLSKFRGSGQSFTLDRSLTGEILNVRNTNNTLASLFSPRPAMAQIGQIPGGGGLPGYYNPGAPSFWFGVGGVAGTSASNTAVAVNGAIGLSVLPTNQCESACWIGSRVACTSAGIGVGVATGGAASPLMPLGTLICGAALTKQCYKAAKCSPCTK